MRWLQCSTGRRRSQGTYHPDTRIPPRSPLMDSPVSGRSRQRVHGTQSSRSLPVVGVKWTRWRLRPRLSFHQGGAGGNGPVVWFVGWGARWGLGCEGAGWVAAGRVGVAATLPGRAGRAWGERDPRAWIRVGLRIFEVRASVRSRERARGGEDYATQGRRRRGEKRLRPAWTPAASRDPRRGRAGMDASPRPRGPTPAKTTVDVGWGVRPAGEVARPGEGGPRPPRLAKGDSLAKGRRAAGRA